MSLALVLATGFAAVGVAGQTVETETVAPRKPPPWERDPAELAPGEYWWFPEVSPAGPVTVVVSIPQQLAHVYRNGILIAVSTVSTGRRGFETPTGVFQVLQKKKVHFSNLYDDAPMPYMVRLTWSGMALHAGHLPGYPASHGCVRLPSEFSQRLYEIATLGATVVISDETVEPRIALRAGQVLNPNASGAAPTISSAPAPAADGPAGRRVRFTWKPEASPEGPLSILLSAADRAVYVYRNGVEIGRSEVDLLQPEEPLGASVFTLLDGSDEEPSVLVPRRPARRWMALPLNGEETPPTADVLSRQVRVPRYFARLVYDLLVPGTTLLVTDLPVARRLSEDGFMVMTAEERPLPDEQPPSAEPGDGR